MGLAKRIATRIYDALERFVWLAPPQSDPEARDGAIGRTRSYANRSVIRTKPVEKVAKLFSDAAAITITAFISPYKADRELARKLHAEGKIPFIEVFVDAPLSVVEERDPKGLYKKARAGEIKGSLFWRSISSSSNISCYYANFPEFTGVSAPYEAPDGPEVHIKTDEKTVTESVGLIVKYLQDNKYI